MPGTNPFKIGEYTTAAFGEFNLTVNSKQVKPLTYNNMKNEINSDKPFLLDLQMHVTYGKNSAHLVAAYAYTRFRNQKNGNYKSFLKVADGWANSGRYIDMITIVNDGGHSFWTVETK